MDSALSRLDDFLLKYSSYTPTSYGKIYFLVFVVIAVIIFMIYIVYKKHKNKQQTLT